MNDQQVSYPKRTEQIHFDLIIIGGGASGISAATRVSQLEKDVLLVNAGLPMGGTCVNIGCVPSKILIEMANDYYYSQFPHYDSILGKCACISDADYSKSVREKNQMVESLRIQNYRVPLEDMANVKVIQGYAKFVNDGQIEVNDRTYSGNKYLIATGSMSYIPKIKGLDEVNYLTSEEALSLEEIPKSLVVIGAGPTGLELAQMFHHFGSEVTVLEKADQVVPGTEGEIADELYRALQDEGISIYLNCNIEGVKHESNSIEFICEIEGDKVKVIAQKVLVATGVTPNTASLNLENTGVARNEKGYITVDEHLRTKVPHIWAAGDVVGRTLLETTAAKEGFLAAGSMFFNEEKVIDYDIVPRAVFTTPNLAVVGLTEDEARKRYERVDTRTIEYTRIPKAVALKETRGKIKMVIDARTGRILGIHMTAHGAAEFVNEAGLIIQQRLTIQDVIDTVHVFPTMSEGIKKVAQAFIRDVSKMACCVE